MGDNMKYDNYINVAIGKSRKELNYVNLELPYSFPCLVLKPFKIIFNKFEWQFKHLFRIL